MTGRTLEKDRDYKKKGRRPTTRKRLLRTDSPQHIHFYYYLFFYVFVAVVIRSYLVVADGVQGAEREKIIGFAHLLVVVDVALTMAGLFVVAARAKTDSPLSRTRE
jgi:hypothetical protein